ncbi:Asp23/Gls24 family envelope stress response protein [Lactobacillus delbrueckii]|uniref:Asp23/Gls24 family envelope stress response protein n=1 Tax=Lactobacillus delbrueckii TaxID=1584 RepID=UPI001E56A807|nr:Asp23/Gls24 family envelope stress response protein [Lactobacillus delbrueckii]MCD5439731.1 Asp23/Gls24 family envelope stress response protein [Lactobacillus delbrueckii subsp. lactis]MCD5483805.1 Asp23/Gls24 family envelope stress response protein [Lactobacillus delbrueckii subsp. lactis]MCD5513850.1 Asp23/Gls24 family envelope stress response protein [Lactobacillus delbrueckii subsp. lactis]MCD5538729.1 Asp23/Gls24 family envelope stress response protein [Lactobacillus delbrueckii subsp. 
MADNSTIVLSGNDEGDQIKIDLQVLEVILGISAQKVDGVAGMRAGLKSGLSRVFGREDRGKGVAVSVDEDGELTADVYVYLKYGVNVPAVAGKIQEALKQQLTQMTDMNLKSIDVHVVGLVFPEDEKNFEDAGQPLFPDQEEDK